MFSGSFHLKGDLRAAQIIGGVREKKPEALASRRCQGAGRWGNGAGTSLIQVAPMELWTGRDGQKQWQGVALLFLFCAGLPFFGEGSPTKIDYGKKGALVLTSLLEDLVAHPLSLK